MSHPPGPPQDPFQPDPDPYGYADPPYYPDPTAPPPPGPGYPPTTPYPAHQPEPSTPPPPYPTSGAPGPVSGGPGYPPPVSGAPGYPPPVSGAPGYPPPVSGAPGYPPPVSGAPGYPPPVSGAPGYPPPVSGAPGYPPPVSGAPGYPPPVSGAPGYPPPVSGAPGYPPPGGGPVYQPGVPPYAPQKSSGGGRTVLLVVGIVVAAMMLLCCAGVVVAALSSDDDADLGTGRGVGGPPTPATSNAPLIAPPEAAPGSGITPTPRPSDRDGETFGMKAGDTLVITDNEGTLEVTINKFTTSNKGCRSFAPDPDEGMYLIADVTARVTKGTASVNPFYFEWVADDGTTTNGLIGALSGCGSPLDSGVSLRTGSKRSGTVVFDVADKKGVVEYQHNFEAAGSWKP
ncbi:DUF4352 domain-containing protein [Micromonospora sp. WMMD882]|uniref:DUF4352 domain-containing protein n=1 Tax=Micromonospora sp. WMMD882 TaxID=3015151 RepID=UPI00248ABF6A|nr:DUF4352 domain-containing protein [Micromonospora sp. WMMD882]WBB77582.1 DUF4352 domain-containing protein [Micromonospora sp. WMMD882]